MYGQEPPLGSEKNNKHTIRVGASNRNVALMHEGHKQLAAYNNRRSWMRPKGNTDHGASKHPWRKRPSRGIGKLAKDLKSAKNKRTHPPPELVRSTGYHHSGIGRWKGIPKGFKNVQDNDLRKNIRAIGRARKRTKRYNKVLKATRGKLPSGSGVPPRARRTIAEFATGAGDYNNKTGSTKSGGSSKSSRGGRRKKRRTRRKKHRRTKRRRKKKRITRRKH